MTTTELEIQGIPVSAIAEEFGTPVYVYDADVIRSTYEELRGLMHPAVDIYLSLKANPNISVCGYLGALGAGAEVSSLVELETVRRAGIRTEDTIFLGPGKTRAELEACVAAGLRAVVCESLEELTVLDGIAADSGRADLPVILRFNPDFHTKGSGLAMGGKPRQFGIDAAQLRDARTVVKGLRRARVIGFHAYMGTRFLHHEDLVHNTREILTASITLASELEVDLRTVDFGGGFGIPYFDNEPELNIPELTAGINEAVVEFLEQYPDCRLINELGRYLTAMCGTYVTRALYVKESMGEQFVVADGGTNHHMAAVGVGSFVKRNFPIRSLSRYHEEPTAEYTLTGPLCTPNDVIGKRVALPEVRPGDLIGVERSGAYGPSASPGLFLSHGFPAEVMVHRGTAHLVRRRDAVEDLLGKQRLISF
ncbi:diaminopimelate decarboxylase [Streptomyces cyaneochromogenes]|uniref:Diaminopimelate decarboxylase n=1 Tax=Streptomyces cyaneochromogenes TaxID=2496836 RepID=A0A3Q9ETC3_9ACTN|nr:diaminopimelate decarboxylase [Streptomyces cyaneochromogenes]AZQ38776.1 diaminopimelate decarboxylase [Streptomyces cyaneochromogenes]